MDSIRIVHASLAELPEVVTGIPTPLVVRGVDFSSGVDRGLLTPQLLASRFERLDGSVQRSRSPLLLRYNRTKRLATPREPGGLRGGATLHRNVSGAALLQGLSRAATIAAWEQALPPTDGSVSGWCAATEWWSYVGLNGSNAVSLAEEMLRIQHLVAAAREAATGTAASSSRNGGHQMTPPSVRLWVGGEGLTSTVEYDVDVHLVAQLHGRTHHLLAAPHAAPMLRPFSFLHPMFGQVQRSLEETAVRNSGPPHSFADVELQPGELLLLPSGYFRRARVESAMSISLSVAVAGQMESAARGLLDRGGDHFGLHAGGLLANPLLEDEKVRVAVLESLTQRLVLAALEGRRAGLASVDAARRWVDATMAARWSPVRSRFTKAIAKRERFCDPVFLRTREISARSALGDDAVDDLDRAVRSAATALRALPVGVAELELANLVEAVALHVLREPKAVCAFVLSCFRGTATESVKQDGEPTTQVREEFEAKFKEGQHAPL